MLCTPKDGAIITITIVHLNFRSFIIWCPYKTKLSVEFQKVWRGKIAKLIPIADHFVQAFFFFDFVKMQYCHEFNALQDPQTPTGWPTSASHLACSSASCSSSTSSSAAPWPAAAPRRRSSRRSPASTTTIQSTSHSTGKEREFLLANLDKNPC